MLRRLAVSLSLLMCFTNLSAQTITTFPIVEVVSPIILLEGAAIGLHVKVSSALLKAVNCGPVVLREYPVILASDPQFKMNRELAQLAFATGKNVAFYISRCANYGAPTAYPIIDGITVVQ